MSITIVTTPGASNANSYADLTEADAWFATQLRSTAWDDALTSATGYADAEDQKRALVMATRLLDEHMDWDGAAAETDQALQWPRVYLYDAVGAEIGGDELPAALKNATAEFAKYLLISDRLAELTSEGVKALKVGSVEIEFSEAFRLRRKVIPDAVYQMISRWGRLRYSGSGAVLRTVRV